MDEIVYVNQTKYLTIRLLGKGKGGYSYLAERVGRYEGEIVFVNFDDPSYQCIDEAALRHKLMTESFPSGYMFEEYPSLQDSYVLLKKIHHEPCDYYTFGNKIEAEKADYMKLIAAGIRVPKMYSVDEDAEIIVKEFIDGPTVADLVSRGELDESILAQGYEMAEKAKTAGLNIDYYPTNFILDKNGVLYYIDYECNPYMEEWSFDNWGIKYWRKAQDS